MKVLTYFFHWILILWYSKHILSHCEGSQECIFHILNDPAIPLFDHLITEQQQAVRSTYNRTTLPPRPILLGSCLKSVSEKNIRFYDFMQPCKKANEILLSKCAECAKCTIVHTWLTIFGARYTPALGSQLFSSHFPPQYTHVKHPLHYITLNYTQYCRTGGTSLCFQLVSILIVWNHQKKRERKTRQGVGTKVLAQNKLRESRCFLTGLPQKCQCNER